MAIFCKVVYRQIRKIPQLVNATKLAEVIPDAPRNQRNLASRGDI